MQAVLLVIHLLLALALVAVVLLQRSEGGALGMGGGGNMGGLLSTRGSANLLTRTTAILAACFITTSLVLAIMAGNTRPARSIVDTPPPAKSAPAKPQGPAVPLAK